MALIQEYNKLYEQNSNIKKIYVNGTRVWPIKFIGYSEPFYVENITNSTETLSIKKSSSSAPTVTVQYSTNGNLWSTLGSTSTTALTKSIPSGSKLYLRASTSSWGNTSTASSRNSITGVSKVGGNIMSLLWGSNFVGKTTFPSSVTNIFAYLFRENTNLITAESLLLPATTLKNSCYSGLFTNCSSLLYGPKELPATTMATSCYRGMFEGCSSLIKCPPLPATTLAETCYRNMFVNCSSLTNPPSLPATTLATGCYQIMFRYCTSLETAPDLEASTLVTDCYKGMFDGCTSLNSVKCLAENNLDSSGPLYIWLQDVAATGTFTKKSGVTWPTGTSGIPSGWTVEEL